MSLTLDIFRAWVRPGEVLRAKLAQGPREDRALAAVMAGCGLIFVAQWPRLAREAALDPSVPMEARVGGALLALVFVLPLLLYAVAAASHLVLRGLGGAASGYGCRLALFWAVLASAPAFLFAGLAAGMLPPGPGLTVIGIAVLAGFFRLWFSMLREANRSGA